MTIPLLFALIWFVAHDQAGQGDARDRPGSRYRRPDGRRRQPHDRDHIPHRRRAWPARPASSQILYNNTTVWNLGFRFGLNSFTAAVLGGIGNLQGAVLGALVLGLINALSDRYFSANWTKRSSSAS